MLVDWVAGRLHNEHIGAANIFQKLEVHFPIGEPLQAYFAKRNADKFANLFGQRQVRCAAENLKPLIFAVGLGALLTRGSACLPS